MQPELSTTQKNRKFCLLWLMFPAGVKCTGDLLLAYSLAKTCLNFSDDDVQHMQGLISTRNPNRLCLLCKHYKEEQ